MWAKGLELIEVVGQLVYPDPASVSLSRWRGSINCETCCPYDLERVPADLPPCGKILSVVSLCSSYSLYFYIILSLLLL